MKTAVGQRQRKEKKKQKKQNNEELGRGWSVYSGPEGCCRYAHPPPWHSMCKGPGAEWVKDGERMLWWAVPRFWVSFPASSLNLDPLFFTCLVFFLAIPMQECKRAFTAQELHSLSRLTQVCWNPQVKDWITLKMKKPLERPKPNFSNLSSS